jgi:hypothetical protein
MENLSKVKEAILAKHPIGSRVKFVKMDNKQALPVGALGTVRGVVQ